jgi:two-component system, NtrC family, response regulator HydG
MPSVLIVDDLLSIHEMLDAVIQPTGFATAFATDGEKAIARYKADKFDLVLADIDMKPMDGITLLRNLKLYDPTAVVIIMTAYASTESAIQALKYGAFDYLQKPFKVDELIKTLKRALDFKNFNAQQRHASVSSASSSDLGEIDRSLVGRSPAMQRLLQQIKKLASGKASVLVHGEAGTGKRMVAEVLHQAGGPERPLVRLDCALCAESEFRSGLIGDGGAGGEWVDQSDGGTLLLDHVECLPLAIQRALVGMLRTTKRDFRLVCTSSQDLEGLVEQGLFCDELFYRVASLPLHLTPLRERIEDIPVLARHFADRTENPSFSSSQIEFSDDALRVLQSHYWPGNVAELHQVVAKVVSTTETRVITSQQLPMRVHQLETWPSLEDYLAGQEKQYVSRVLHACKNDLEQAARVLRCDSDRVAKWSS